jgi:uncharacterized NAD(P)/FAD-binding protein YdhS
MKTIAIIGGGFCGTMAAVNIVRLANEPLQVVLVNDRHPLGRGVAYGTTQGEHLLNVAARNMSALPDHPEHFLNWLRTRVDYADIPDPQLREMFVPRRVFGDYLRSLLFNYLEPVDGHHPAKIEVIEDEVTGIVESDGAVTIGLRDGASFVADRVLLATGNQPPLELAGAAELLDHPGYCADPWSGWQDQLPDPTQDIVILGSGLTMVDVFLTLSGMSWSGKIVSVSRNGRVPHAHFRGIDYPDFLPADPENVGLDGLVELLEKHCQQLLRLGANPGIVVDRLRPHTQRIWQNFSIEEKRCFLAKHAARWNVIRHRIAQPVHQRLTEAITDGSVRVVKGSVSGIRADGESVEVALRHTDGSESSITGGLVINCTGPRSGFADTTVPLFRQLLDSGMLRADELDMGIEVGPDFAVIDGDGVSSKVLFAIGPLMKGTLWESTAVPELRGQAKRAAEILARDEIAGDEGSDLRMSVEAEHVVEYYI